MNRSAVLVSLFLAAGLVAGVPSAHAQQVLSAPGPAPSELDKKLAQEDDIATLQALIPRFRAQHDLEGEASVWKRLVALRPHLGNYKLEMAAAYAQQDKKSLAYSALLELQQQGYAYDVAADPRFKPVATTEAWDYIVQSFAANRKPFGETDVVATLPAEDLLIESVAWDPSRKQLLVGSAREGRVDIVGKDGALKPLVVANDENGLWAVFDLVVDDKRGVLWVASTAVPHFKGYDAESDLGKAGLFRFDLKTGKFEKRFLSPSGIGLNFFMSSLALAPDGTVYAADGVNNAVYKVQDDKLQRVFHAPVLGSIRGLAVSGDGSTLYFADYERGLFGYDLASNKPFDVLVPKTLTLGGIDGLFWSGHGLIAVQNGIEPKRIMRLELSPDGHTIDKVVPLAANLPALSMPSQGTLHGDDLYVIGNSQKANYDRFGLPRDRSKLEGARIVHVDIDWPAKQAAETPTPAAQ